MARKPDCRLVIRLSDDKMDQGFHQELITATKILGCTKSHLVRSAVEYALKHPELLQRMVAR